MLRFLFGYVCLVKEFIKLHILYSAHMYWKYHVISDTHSGNQWLWKHEDLFQFDQGRNSGTVSGQGKNTCSAPKEERKEKIGTAWSTEMWKYAVSEESTLWTSFIDIGRNGIVWVKQNYNRNIKFPKKSFL